MKWLLLLFLVGCHVPTDPCPLPPEQHPEAWQRITLTSPTGVIGGYTYVCVVT